MALPVEMQQVIAEGYARALGISGARAASLFARLVAYRMNPTGNPAKPGWLTKGSGANIDGYSVDSIVMNANPSDLYNVYDCVANAEASNAAPSWGGPNPRRIHDTWEAPKPLTESELLFLQGDTVTPPPPPPPPPPCPTLDRGEFFQEMLELDRYYTSQEGLQRPNGLSRNGRPDFEGIAAWIFDIFLNLRLKRVPVAEARAMYIKEIRKSDEWMHIHPGEVP